MRDNSYLKENNVFLNTEYANELIQNGVVKIPFLTSNEILMLNKFYDEMHPDGSPPILIDGIHMTIWHSNLEYKYKIRDGLKEILTPAFQRNFTNYRALSQQFIIKTQGTSTTFPIHQDWSIVDESKHFSLNIWIPLHDVDEYNGAMWIIKKSHKIGNMIRGAGLLFPNFTKLIDKLEPFMTSYKMKVGEALIFYHSTIHGSPTNLNYTYRKVIQTTLLPIDASKQIYFQSNPKNPLEIHHPVDDFSFSYNNIRTESENTPPTSKPSENIEGYSFCEITFEDIMKAIS